MKIKILDTGEIHCVYNELIDLSSFGKLQVKRASTVEFDADSQKWIARLTDQTFIGSFHSRTAAIAAEIRNLESRL